MGGGGILISMQRNSSIHSDEHPKADNYPMKGGPYHQKIIIMHDTPVGHEDPDPDQGTERSVPGEERSKPNGGCVFNPA